MSLIPTKFLTLAVMVYGGVSISHAGPVLDKVRSTQVLSCGINRDLIEYSKADGHGNRAIFDSDLCTAVAVAVLGPHAKTTLAAYPDEPGSLEALHKGEVALIPTATVDFNTTVSSGLGYGYPILYDAQSFIVPKRLHFKSAADLSGKRICVLEQTAVWDNLHDYVTRTKFDFRPFPFQEQGEMEAAFVTNNCQAIASDVTQLANMRVAFRRLADNYEILPDSIANDPLAPFYPANDPEWAAIVEWTMQALIHAEAEGITKDNVDAKLKSEEFETSRLLGITKGYASKLHLVDDWAANVIRTVGNYAEIYERGLGMGSPFKIPRGPNELNKNGGLLYPLPLRIDHT
jgi:general L-amino acid transport system substrate-binding protein